MEKSFIKSIELSFNKANKGQEQLNIIIYWWGVLAYLIAYFILNKIIFLVDIKTIDILVSILACIYFIWHIFVLHKCKPKKPDLSDEEKKKIELERKKEMPKKIIRKIFLREPIFKWNIISVITAVDLFAVAHFSGYFFR
jgi:hypothetical protein